MWNRTEVQTDPPANSPAERETSPAGAAAPIAAIQAPKHQKRYSLELLRFFCAFSIVWGHLGAPRAEIAYAGLDTFIILSVALSTRASMRHPLRPFMAQRARRILLPWLYWSLFYLVLRGVTQGPAAVFTITDPLWLLVGPEIHMWFLPFLFLSAPLAYSATHLPHGRVFGGIFVLLAVPLGCTAYYLEWIQALPIPFIQWAFALPALLYAITRASGRNLGPVFILVGSLMCMAILKDIRPAVYLCLSALLFECALRIRTVGPWAQILGDTAFGIYLSHPFFILVWTRYLDFETQKLPLVAVVFLSSFFLSLLMIWVGRKFTRATA